MKRRILFLAILMFATGAATFAMTHYYYASSSIMRDTTVIVKKGAGSHAAVKALAEAGALRFPYMFYAIEFVSGRSKKFKAGEYSFCAGTSPQEISRKLTSGEVVIHKVTIPEGWNVREVRAALMVEPVLSGELTRPLSEGSVLPETYHFTYGDTRDGVAARMQAAMDRALEEEWQKRAEGLPLNSKQEALVLASIVEKETGVPEERARVAAVFVNRLKRGMRLQTDPSVIYGIEQQTGAAMGRLLTTTDLETPTPYNTYVIPGLPPTPIANPSLDAIRATLHPLATDEIYFVATGTGGHAFATTLEEHNRNVAAYRAALKAAE